MNFYLSSYHLGTKPEYLKKMVGANRKTAIVLNALDLKESSERAQFLYRFQEDLKALDLEGVELDLRDYFSSSKGLKEELLQFGALYVTGGNAFLLRRAMKYSALDKALKSLLQENSLVYSGFSAGICVLAPSLRGLELVDEKDRIAESYKKEIVWEGLALVDFAFAPHYRSDHPESADIEKTVEYYKKNNISYRALKDGEALVIQGTQEKKVGGPA